MSDATATSTESEPLTSDVKIEDIGPAARRLTITVTAEVVDQKLEDAMGTLSASTALPGFRKGRAPRALLERRFGTVMRNEAKSQLVAAAYAEVIEKHELKTVGDPEPEAIDELEMEPGKPMTFAVKVEVMPEFDMPSFEGIEVKKPTLEIGDEHIEREVRRYSVQLGDMSKIDGDFVEGDRMLGRASVTRTGEAEPFFSHEQVLIVHPGEADGGRGQVLGLLVDGLAGSLKGKRVTDSITLETTGPEGHEREDIRGVDLVIEYEINQAERVEPASIEAVVAGLGLGTEEILREQIRLSLEQRRDEEQAAAMRRQIADALVGLVDFELPQKLSERQVTRNLERYRLELLYEGLSTEEIEDRLAEVRAESESGTRDQLKLYFMLHRLSDHFGIEVSEQETNGRVAALAARRGVRPEQLMNELVQSGRLGTVKSQIREEKALDRVLHHASVTEVSAEDWRKHVEAREKKAAPAKKTTTRKKTTKKTTAAAGGKKKTTKKKKQKAES